MTNTPLDQLIKMLSSLPGLGNRSARRIALHLLSKRDTVMIPLGRALETAAQNIKNCHLCGNLDMRDPCHICNDTRRDHTQICIVANVSDVWAIERTGAFKGLYHVLGGVLSALDGIGPDDLHTHNLKNRILENNIQEIILALSATVDGQSTAHFINDKIIAMDIPWALSVTRLAHGVPVGGELDYLDDGTITTALKSRSSTGS